MRVHPHIASLVGALMVAAFAIAGSPLSAQAASAQRSIASAPITASSVNTPGARATHITDKVILPETSIDGPALDSVATGGTNESVIAWTGTDALNHLNVETSADGLHFGHKLILDDTSAFRPDVAIGALNAPISVAWTGTDPNHSLNVLYDVYGSPEKLTLWNENSFTAPALLNGPGSLWLAWAGTDPNHSLNILPIAASSSGLVAGTKVILSQDSSDAAPHLRRGSATVIDLDWASSGLQLTLAGATTPQGLQPGTGLPETSASAPDTFVLGSFIGAGGKIWVGWTGTDLNHHLNLEWADGVFPGTKTILAETALGGPALSYNGGYLVAWTGADVAHHLNVARFDA
ncbi:MAG TPA: hypothetical protein VMV29_20370 [Ktedonobacterales bacterium]|nr:hypothetical protein [Ktedonobacterales bacterium]